MAEYIDREAVLALIDEYTGGFSYFEAETAGFKKDINDLPAADVVSVPDGGIGEISDGYHTFNSLYRQRLILTAALVKAHKDIAWKSWKHEDGELCFGGGWFIVGFDTPDGGYTYHYKAKYWDLFDCVELPVGKHWDGHTDKDVERLLSIPAADVAPVRHGKWIEKEDPNGDPYYVCSVCNAEFVCVEGTPDENQYYYCPNCGARMDGGEGNG